jgi:hypothetical protein
VEIRLARGYKVLTDYIERIFAMGMDVAHRAPWAGGVKGFVFDPLAGLARPPSGIVIYLSIQPFLRCLRNRHINAV